MELKQYILPLARWWWLLVLATLVAAISSFLAVKQQPPIYQVYATLMIGRMIQDPNPNSGEIYLVQQLADTYANIANREPMKNATMRALGLPFLPDNATRSIPGSPLIEITVTDIDARRAQAVANELANQLIKSSPSGVSPDSGDRQTFVNEQLDNLQTQIKEANTEIEKLQKQFGDLISAQEIADMEAQITAQQQKLTLLQTNYASLLATTQKGATNSLSLIEPAGLPSTPIGPNVMLTVGLTSLIGLSLASLAAYGIEAMDDTIKSTEEINQLIKSPILGFIGEIPQTSKKMTFFVEEPRSPISDAFRLLRTNLEFIGSTNPHQVILITSPETSDGKSTIASNMAASIAQSLNKKVVLIDADLRKPTLHTGLSIENRNGLSEICLGTVSIKDALVPFIEGKFEFIPAGVLPLNPVELLSSYTFPQLIDDLRSSKDVIIIDSPPVFLADTLILSRNVDGILVVISPGRTRKKSIVRMLDHLQKTGTNLLGIVINRLPINDNEYSGYYYKGQVKKIPVSK